jgi:beta-mannanase
LITWEPWQLPDDLPAGVHPFDQPEFSVDKITLGLYDKYVRSWARTLADTKKLVYLRPMHEMNGNWYPWGGTTNGNSAAAFRQAWRYLREVFRQEGANNVTWVWCPYVRSVPDIPENALESYFPGEDQVDWLGLDGYNWGTTQPWFSWERFADVFGPAYERLARLAPGSPVMIAETGCTEEGGDKALWITEALESLASDLIRVQILVWFNLNKECDWRIDSSPNSLQAFQKEAWRFQLP